MDPDGREIQVLVETEDCHAGSKGVFESLATSPVRAIKMSGAELNERLKDFCAGIDGILQDVTAAVSRYELDSLEVTAELTARGEVRMIGCAGAEVSGGLKLVFRRRAGE